MSLFDFIFGARKEKTKAATTFRLLNGYTPRFTSWSGSIYESELVRAAIDARARHISKLQPVIEGSAKQSLKTLLDKAPNAYQTWGQFLYRTSTILDVRNTCFIVPILDRYGGATGFYPIAPQSWELVQVSDVPWIRFYFDGGQRSAIELIAVGILTKFQYKSDFFGESNAALADTMDLIKIQRQGIEEYAKNSSSYRFVAKVSNFTKPEDLAKERRRFDAENFQASDGGGVLLFPNTYNEIKQVNGQNYSIDSGQMELIQQNVFTYFGVNKDVLQNAATGDAWAAFYEGAIEPFAIQLSDVMTRMAYTLREQTSNRIFFTANRLQYMTNSDKLKVSAQMLDRGIMNRDEVRAIWNLPPLPDGQGQEFLIRGEYMSAGNKLKGDSEDETE